MDAVQKQSIHKLTSSKLKTKRSSSYSLHQANGLSCIFSSEMKVMITCGGSQKRRLSVGGDLGQM